MVNREVDNLHKDTNPELTGCFETHARLVENTASKIQRVIANWSWRYDINIRKWSNPG